MIADPPTGRVVMLNGASSAGKSTLARVLQDDLAAAGSPWIVFSWDDFVPRLPGRWRSVPGSLGDRSDDGCSYRLVREEPMLEALLEVGVVGRRLLAGYHRSIAALARAGVDVIVEEVMISADEWEDWRQALGDVDVRWIAVRCDTEIVERRESQRRDRYPGLARGTSSVVHLYATYDLEVDSSRSSPEEMAQEIVAAMDR